MVASPLLGSMILTNMLLISSLVIASILCVYSYLTDPKADSHVVGEIYLLAFGMNMTGAAMSTSAAVASGILVCNCIDELSR